MGMGWANYLEQKFLAPKPKEKKVKKSEGNRKTSRPPLRKPHLVLAMADDLSSKSLLLSFWRATPRPTQFVEAIQPPNPQNSPKLQNQFQPQVQQSTYQPKPQLNSPVLGTRQVGSQPSRNKPLVKAPTPAPSDQGAASLPFTQCPSAMKCVEKKLCDFNGVMRDFVTTLSPAQETLRVPLIPCVSQRAGSEVDVCCRDPNYKDPWPEQEQAREESRAHRGLLQTSQPQSLRKMSRSSVQLPKPRK